MSTQRIRPDAGWHPSSARLAACRYCGGALPKGRRSFCSGAKTTYGWRKGTVPRVSYVLTAGHGCVHEWCLRTQPAYARQAVWERDHGICGGCGGCGVQCKPGGESFPDDTQPTWQADHIVPVVEGGGECGLEGLRTLCSACHKIETAALARRRAEARRAARST